MICILSIDFNFHFIRVKRGDRIAQLICEKIEMAHLVEEQVCVLMFFFLYLLVYIL
jgi:dUTPase